MTSLEDQSPVFHFPLSCEDNLEECEAPDRCCDGNPPKCFPRRGEDAKRYLWDDSRNEAEQYLKELFNLQQEIEEIDKHPPMELRNRLYDFFRRIPRWHKNEKETDRIEEAIMHGEGLTQEEKRRFILKKINEMKEGLRNVINRIELEYPDAKTEDECFEYPKGCTFIEGNLFL
jgi:hypothetical protein